MIDPVTAIAGATAAFNAIKSGFSVGRDIENMAGDLGRWMNCISDLKKAEEQNKIVEEIKRKDEEIAKGIKPKSFFQKYMIYIIIVILLILVGVFFMFSGKSGGSDMDMDFDF